MTSRTRFALKLTAFSLLCALFVTAVLVAQYHEKQTNTAEKPALQSININYASAEELQQLDGLDDTLAANILAYRDTFVFFGTIDDLLVIEGVTEDLLALWRPYITV